MLLNKLTVPNQFVAQAVDHVAIYQDGVVSIYRKDKTRADLIRLATSYPITGVRAIAISPNGEYVCVQTKKQTIRLRAGVQTPFNSTGPFSVADTGQIVMVNVSGGAVQVIEDSTTNLTVAVTDDDRVVCAAGRYMVYNRVRTITAKYSDLVLTPISSAKEIVSISHDNQGQFIVFYADGTMLYNGQTKTPVMPVQGFRGLGDQLIATDYKTEFSMNRWRPLARPEFIRPFKWRAPSPLNALSEDTLMLAVGDGLTNATFDKLGLSVVQQGNVTIADDSPYGSTGKSFKFNGSTSYLTTADSSAWQLGTKDFTVKLNVKINSINETQAFIFQKGATGNVNTSSIALRVLKSTQKFRLTMSANGSTAAIADIEFGSVVLGEWTQIVITRSGTKIRCFQNGRLVGSATSSLGLTAYAGNGVQIGHIRLTNFNTGVVAFVLDGNIHNFQLLNYAEHRTDYFADMYPETYQTQGLSSTFFVTDAPISYKFSMTPGATIEVPPSIGSDTIVLASGNNDTLDVVFSDALNLSTTDWTLEWSTFNLETSTTYCSQIALLPETGSIGITVRYGDGGFGNRLQFGGLVASASQIYNATLTKADALNTLKQFALVKKGQAITLYIEGIRQNLAIGTGSTYDQTSFTLDSDLTAIKRVRLGNISSGGITLAAKHGQVKLTMSAKYNGDYSPEFTPPKEVLSGTFSSGTSMSFTTPDLLEGSSRFLLPTVDKIRIVEANLSITEKTAPANVQWPAVSLIDDQYISIAGLGYPTYLSRDGGNTFTQPISGNVYAGQAFKANGSIWMITDQQTGLRKYNADMSSFQNSSRTSGLPLNTYWGATPNAVLSSTNTSGSKTIHVSRTTTSLSFTAYDVGITTNCKISYIGSNVVYVRAGASMMKLFYVGPSGVPIALGDLAGSYVLSVLHVGSRFVVVKPDTLYWANTKLVDNPNATLEEAQAYASEIFASLEQNPTPIGMSVTSAAAWKAQKRIFVCSNSGYKFFKA